MCNESQTFSLFRLMIYVLCLCQNCAKNSKLILWSMQYHTSRICNSIICSYNLGLVYNLYYINDLNILHHLACNVFSVINHTNGVR